MEIACCSTATATAASLPLQRRSRSPKPSRLSLVLAASSSSFASGGAPQTPLVSVPMRRLRSRSRSGGVALKCKCLFGLGVPELAVIAGVAALVFGPKQLPEIGRNIGKTIKGFQQAAKEFETELKKTPPEDGAASPENPQSVAGAEPKKELETSTTKESV